ncbi:MAG: hypothetical protein IPO98_01000 [Saprospiraceae bacterium]|nr:hypothetical protein [Saprospiraceae bacterium]
MRNIFLGMICLSIFVSFQSCLNDSCTEARTFVQYTPVYMTKAQFRTAIKSEPVRKLENPGKFYFYKTFLFINDQGVGIHVYDLKNESKPVKVGFYNIPGNFDIAIKENILYADNVIDLVALDISDISQPKVVNRIEDYKGQYINYDPLQYYAYAVKSDQTTILDCSDQNFSQETFVNGGVVFFDKSTAPNTSVISSTGSNTGVGGSFARFTVVNDYLYVVDQNSLKSYLVDNPEKPVLKHTNQLGWGIETIFPFKDKLFVGSNSGMYIFDNNRPETPVLQSVFDHARACDPVVVDDNTAYVTLRDGNTCTGFTNQLDVIDITNVLNPKLIKSYPMKHPHGLSVYDKKLYLAEGVYGFKVLDVANPEKVNQLGEVTGIHSYDMISLTQDRLFMIGEDGFYLYNVSDGKKPILISTIKKNE